ncbi:MAG TPA: di-heme-cytochrome C peroxidase [Caulobacteraceae bacterium]
MAAIGLAGCADKKPLPPPPQGWTLGQQDWWSNIDQGSRLVPAAWLQALEQPGPGAGKFMDVAYLGNFRFLPPRADAPAGTLPVGMAVDGGPDDNLVKTRLRWFDGQDGKQPWVGLTCATCHTAQLDYQGQSVRVFGAPNLFDFQGFVEALDQALIQTRDSAAPGADGARWDRFAKAVLQGPGDTPANRGKLLGALNQLIAFEQQSASLNDTPLRYGYGRVDAVGHIFNRVLLFDGADQPLPHNASDAPVSYPHLWDITREYQVQWDGIAKNSKISGTPFDYGAMGRNTGEVLGVFGEAALKPKGQGLPTGYDSSVQILTLNQIETLLTILKPPSWPSDRFGQPGAIDVAGPNGQKLTPDQVVAAGHQLFDGMCSACHGGKLNEHGGIEQVLTFSQLGPANLTDIWMACNAWADKGASGALTGVPVNYLTGTPLQSTDQVSSILTAAVIGSMLHKSPDMAHAALQSIFGTALPHPQPHALAVMTPAQAKEQRKAQCMAAASDPLMAYKARPLDGIWATGPFLHNGSVPTLHDLLSAPAQRPVTFLMGARQFDPKNVGYAIDPSAPGNTFTYDTRLAGNSNAGHVYGVDKLTEPQRLELLEYLKTL